MYTQLFFIVSHKLVVSLTMIFNSWQHECSSPSGIAISVWERASTRQDTETIRDNNYDTNGPHVSVSTFAFDDAKYDTTSTTRESEDKQP